MKQRIVAMAAMAATPAPGLGVVAGVRARAEVIDDDDDQQLPPRSVPSLQPLNEPARVPRSSKAEVNR